MKNVRHDCDEVCVSIVRERLNSTCPPYWNSLPHERQQAWLAQDHYYAFSMIHRDLPAKRKAQWAVTRFFRRLFARKQFERTQKHSACPTCGKES